MVYPLTGGFSADRVLCFPAILGKRPAGTESMPLNGLLDLNMFNRPLLLRKKKCMQLNKAASGI